MANNPFTAQSERNNNVPRSTHDMSFQSNISLRFGRLYPVFCQEVLAGETHSIQATFGLRTLPLVFPTQTRMRAKLHYFYVRNRTLWEDWQDFIFHTKSNLTPPRFGKNNKTNFGTCSLMDTLGLPSVVYSNQKFAANIPLSSSDTSVHYTIDAGVAPLIQTFPLALQPGSFKLANSKVTYDETRWPNLQTTNLLSSCDYGTINNVAIHVKTSDLVGEKETEYKGNNRVNYTVFYNPKNFTGSFKGTLNIPMYIFTDSNQRVISVKYPDGENFGPSSLDLTTGVLYFSLNPQAASLATDMYLVMLSMDALDPQTMKPSIYKSGICPSSPLKTLIKDYIEVEAIKYPDGLDLKNVSPDKNPFTNGDIPTSTLPCRAYDAIYNSFYRNQQLDPLVINGEIEYNKFTRSQKGGEDNDTYDYYNVNWESDIFTTCLPSPQQGAAPLVGITNAETQSIAYRSPDGKVYQITPHTSDDGSSLESIDVTDSKENNVISVAQAFTQGITINDLRNVNALQKYLELNQRKGYRYKDLVKGHFDVDIKYDELNYPEFIGGIAKDLFVNPVTATAESSGNSEQSPTVLGDLGAQAGVIGQSERITKYCDEHGFIIGVLSIVPVPVYSQTMPRFFSKMGHLDYFTPEFANIGMQPISKDLLCPLQFRMDSTLDHSETTFGYQRPWADYVRNLDQSHGLFRTSLRNFILNREFDSVPSLGRDFIQCNGDHLNDIFASTLPNEDKLIGDIYFDYQKQSPVPFISIPQLD